MNSSPAKAIIYLVQHKGTDNYKLGWTYDLKKRLYCFYGHYRIPFGELMIIKAICVPWERRRQIEKSILHSLSDRAIGRKWYRLTADEASNIAIKLNELEERYGIHSIRGDESALESCDGQKNSRASLPMDIGWRAKG